MFCIDLTNFGAIGYGRQSPSPQTGQQPGLNHGSIHLSKVCKLPNNKNKHEIQIGAALRTRRRRLDLTLAAVAQETGLSVGFLSQVERNLTTPSLSSLAAIAKALDAGVDYFLATPRTNGLVNRKQGRQCFTVDGLPLKYARVSNDLANGQLHGVITEIPPGWVSERNTHEGEDFVYIISGTETIVVGDETYILNEGDTIHYDASIPHSWGNPTDKPSFNLFVGTQPLFPKSK